MRLSDTDIALAHRGVNLKVDMYIETDEPYWKEMVKTVDNRELFLRTISIAALPPAQAVNEGALPYFADIQVPWGADFYKIKRAMAFALTAETVDRDELGVFKQRVPMIGRSISQSRNIALASFMNLAQQGGTNFTCPDGFAWAYNAHPTATSTFSNILSSQGALGPGTLAQALAELSVQPDHNGIPTGYRGEVTLWVHPFNQDEATRLVEARGYPNTNSNDPNVATRQIVRVLANPFFTNPGYWAVVASGDKNPFNYIEEVQTDFAVEYDSMRQVYMCANFSRWGQGMFDARGWVFSPGL